MTRDLLQQKKTLLQGLERSEREAKRIEKFLHGATSGTSPGSSKGSGDSVDGGFSADEVESIDSGDFPPTHSESSPPQRSKSISRPNPPPVSGNPAPNHRKSSSYSAPSSSGGIMGASMGVMSGAVSSGFLAKGFGKLNYAIHGIVDVDPERTRRDNIGKTKEALEHLEMAREVAEGDVKDASRGVLKDLRRFQRGKEADLRAMMVSALRALEAGRRELTIDRWFMPIVILSGRRKIWRAGKRRKRKWRRSWSNDNTQ